MQSRTLQQKAIGDLQAQIRASEAAAQARDQLALAAIQALATAGGIDPTPIVDAVTNAGDDIQTQLADLHRQLADVQAENEALDRALAAAPQLAGPEDNNGRGDAEEDEAAPAG